MFISLSNGRFIVNANQIVSIGWYKYQPEPDQEMGYTGNETIEGCEICLSNGKHLETENPADIQAIKAAIK